MNSEWVKTEIRKARKREVTDHRRMLFPVSLVGYKPLKEWAYFDAEIGKDSAVEIREFFIPDFSSWKTNHDAYQQNLDRLVKSISSIVTRPPRTAPSRAASKTSNSSKKWSMIPNAGNSNSPRKERSYKATPKTPRSWPKIKNQPEMNPKSHNPSTPRSTNPARPSRSKHLPKTTPFAG